MFTMDIFEPQQIEELLKQSISVSRIKLNVLGYADYLWHDILGMTNQVERKQIDEILSSVDRVEEQLRREITMADRTYLIYEGTFEPIAGVKVGCQSFRKAKDGKIMVPGHKYNTSFSGVMAWFDQLDRAGITVVNTMDYVTTAITLVALYNNSNKEEHTTLQRYIKTKIYPKPFNPHVLTLMGIADVNIGEEIATALVERFGTVYYILGQEPEELASTIIGERKDGGEIRFGINRARKLLKAVGRSV